MRMGISPELVGEFKKAYHIEKSYDVWTFLLNTNLLITREAYAAHKDWFRLPLQTPLLKYINSNLQIVYPDNNPNIVEGRRIVNFVGTDYFDSMAHYLLFKKNIPNCVNRIKKPEDLDEINAVHDFLGNVQNFCGNDFLFEQFKYFNRDELIITNLFYTLMSASKQFVAGNGDSKITFEIIKHTGNLILITEITKHIILAQEDTPENLEPNLREKMIFLITPTEWKLVGYFLQVKNYLAPIIMQAFEDAPLKLSADNEERIDFKTQESKLLITKLIG